MEAIKEKFKETTVTKYEVLSNLNFFVTGISK